MPTKTASKKPKIRKKVKPKAPSTTLRAGKKTCTGSSCGFCDDMPLGSCELISLLIVTVACLTAVLMTSVVALQVKAGQVDSLQEQVTLLEQNL